MSQRGNLILSIFLGFCGGLVAPYVSQKLAGAEEGRGVERVVSAQKFILVNDHGVRAGVFGFDKKGTPEIMLVDPAGNVIWSTRLRLIPLAH